MVSLASPAAALRVGKWLKADLLVMGRVVTTPRQQRVLRLEVVDANRADVLAEIAIKLQSRLGWPLATADFDVEIVAQKISFLDRMKNLIWRVILKIQEKRKQLRYIQ